MKVLPKVLLVGGPDVDARLAIMHCLKDKFDMGAVGSEPSLQDRFLAEGFDYDSYHLSRRANPIQDLLTVSQLILLLRRLKPQIVHTYDTKPGIWARFAARLAGVPIVIGTLPGLGSLYTNDSLKTRLIRWLYEWLQTFACRLSDLTIFQNHDDARQFTEAGVVSEDKVKLILGSGIPTETFDPSQVSDDERLNLRNELGLGSDEIVVTMISRVIRTKGILEFVTTAQDVESRFPHVRFLLIGPSDDNSVDRLTPAQLSELKESVIWPGPRRDIPTVLAMSDIFVLPSAYREGIPRVLLEAASMELPIVTTDSPGCNEVVEHGLNGFLVPVNDSRALTKAIVRLIEHPELRQDFGRASRQRAVTNFDLSVVAEQTWSTYQQLLSHNLS